MKITYFWNQPPGFGGAATEAYETVKAWREKGHDVHGVCVDHCGKCPPAKFRLPYDTRGPWHDPDRIRDIDRVPLCKFDPLKYIRPDDQAVLAKNYYCAIPLSVVKNVPTFYVTSGIDELCWSGQDISKVGRFNLTGNSTRAMTACTWTICHSTIDAAIYRANLNKNLQAKLLLPIVRTPNIAATVNGLSLTPWKLRQYDLCLSASDWTRKMKGPLLAVTLATRLRDLRIAVCGANFKVVAPHIARLGLISHDDQIKVLCDSRIVAIPSAYDPSPNLYVEAWFAGCSVIVSPNVGNIEGHPQALNVARDPDSYERAIRLALSAGDAVKGPRPQTPAEAASDLLGRVLLGINRWRKP